MSEPTREQVEAVARSINPEAYEEWPIGYVSMRAAIGLQRRNLERDLTSLLTSTDPAVHAAMQDALVRAGRLTEEPAWREMPDESWKVRRFVTEWTDA